MRIRIRVCNEIPQKNINYDHLTRMKISETITQVLK